MKQIQREKKHEYTYPTDAGIMCLHCKKGIPYKQREKPKTKQIPYTYHLEDLEFKESEWMGVKEPALYKGIGVVLSKKGRKIIDKTVKQDTEDYKNLEKIYLGEKITSILLRQIIDDDIKRTYQELLSLIQSELDRVREETNDWWFEENKHIKKMCYEVGYSDALSQYKKELRKKIDKWIIDKQRTYYPDNNYLGLACMYPHKFKKQYKTGVWIDKRILLDLLKEG